MINHTKHADLGISGAETKALAVDTRTAVWASTAGRIFLRATLRLQSPYTGVSTPSTPEIPKKSQKGLPGPPRPECQKSVGTFSTLFDTPGREAREDHMAVQSQEELRNFPELWLWGGLSGGSVDKPCRCFSRMLRQPPLIGQKLRGSFCWG